jgi:hypothetical protein
MNAFQVVLVNLESLSNTLSVGRPYNFYVSVMAG